MAEETQKKTPRDLLRAVFRHRTLFLASAALFAFATLVGACWWPLKYTAIAKLERRSDPASEDLVRGRSESFDALKMTLQHELVGTNAVEAAAEELEKKGLLPALPRGQDGKLMAEGKMLRQGLVRNLSADLKVIFEVRSQEVDLVSVSFTDPDPRLAQELPNMLITNYINRISEQIVTNLTSSRDFLQTKVDEANTRFTELTRKRIDFETKYAGMLPDNPGALQQEIQRVTTDMDTVRRQQALAKQKLDQIKSILGRSAAPEGDGSAAESALSAERDYRDATQDLARLQDQQQQYQRSLDESRTLLHMTEKHPRVVALRKQIDGLDKRIAELKVRLPDLEKRLRESRAGALVGPASGETVLDPGRQRDQEMLQANLTIQETTAQSEYQMATNELERLQARQAALQGIMNNYGPVRQEYLEMIKEVTDQQAEVDRWQKRRTEVQMALAAEAAKHRTHLTQVELAQEQFKPSSPKLLYVLALAIVGGLAFGGGLVFLTNTVDRSITTTEEAAAHFGLPVLGSIGEIMTAPQRARRKMIRWGLGPVAAVVAALAIGAAALNIALWLNSREQYSQWRASPVRFVVSKIGDSLAGKI
ncbi:MAG TPA: hypothetical protein VNA25_05345 [Phycisphaerae bacterium]|nr:hypothetical protein [Phycisphaerae bacterium]